MASAWLRAGRSDDKGQVMTFLEAFRAWKAVHGALPVTVTALIEGEEESGSTSLPGFLAEHAASLGKAAIAIISDTNAWDIDTPAITYRLRGNVYVEVTLQGPSRDLHSGLYGGAAVNPLNALTEILGQLHDRDGRVQLPGFYDGVAGLSPEERQAWAALSFDEAGFLGEIGLTQSVGEAGYSALERLWARPTCDLHGIWGGYTGPGSKTVIASRASAKLSFRTVPNQDPAKILQGLRAVSGRADAARLQVEHRGDERLGRHSCAQRRAFHAGRARRRSPISTASPPPWWVAAAPSRWWATCRKSWASIPSWWALDSPTTASTARTRNSNSSASRTASSATPRSWRAWESSPALRPRSEITAPSGLSFCPPATSQKALHISDMRPFLRLAGEQNSCAI